MQRNGACQCVCMCIHLPLHTFRNHNGKYILKWKHQRTYLWPCSDTTHSVSQRWCWFTPEWGQGAESLSTQSSRGSKKSAWGFSPLLLCFFRCLPWTISASSSSRTWMWQLLRLCISGKGEQLCAGPVLTENTSNATQTRMDPFPQCPSSHETWQKSTTEAAGFAANLLPFTWLCVSSALTSPVSFCCVHPPFSAEPLPSGRRGDLI